MLEICERLALHAEKLGDVRWKTASLGIGHWLRQPAAHIVFCGEFKRGKSTLVNALLGIDICPTDVLPSTAVPTVIGYSNNPYAEIHYLDGHCDALELTQSGLARFSVGTDFPVETVKIIDIGLSSNILKDGLVFIDTPGVNDLSQQRAEITYGFIPLADAAVVVLDATAPITKTEQLFLTEHVLPNMIDRLVFVLGKIDRLDEVELEESLAGTRARLRELLKRDIDVLPISALQARKGNDAQLKTLRYALESVRTTCKKYRTEMARIRLTKLATDIFHDVKSRITFTDVSEDEITFAHLALEKAKANTADNFMKFQEYIEVYGRNTLKELVRASLNCLIRELETEILHNVETLPGRIEAFVHQQVPFLVSKRIRQWSEVKGPEIQVFLAKLVERVSSDFAVVFAMPLELAALPRSLGSPEIEVQRRNLVINRTQEFLMAKLLPTAVPMAAGLILLGPLGAIAGSVVGQFATTKIEESQLEKQRAEGREIVIHELEMVSECFMSSLIEEINRWFDQFQAILRESIQERSERSERLLFASRKQQVEELNAISVELDSIIRKLLSGGL